jgi:hypothetical protein
MAIDEAIAGPEGPRDVAGGDDDFVGVLIVKAPRSWPLDMRGAFKARVSAAVEGIAARYNGVPRIVLKLNNARFGEPCAWCQGDFQADVGWALFLDGTHNAVCDDCARQYSPELLDARDVANRQRDARR